MKIVILDSETTGNSEKDRICQLAYLVTTPQLEIEEYYNHLVKPPVEIGFEAMAIHHITPEMVEKAPPLRFTQGFKRLKELNHRNNILVLHNASYDLEMLKREGFNSHFRLIDTFRVMKHLYPEGRYGLQYNRYKLGLYRFEEELKKKLGIEIKAHDALGDVLVLYLLLKYLMETHSLSLEEMIELTQKPIIYDRFYFGKHKFKEIKEVLIEDPEYIESLLEDPTLSPDIRVSILHHQAQLSQKPIYRFSSGKYRGMTPEDVGEFDPDYLWWALHNLAGLSKGFRSRIREIWEEKKRKKWESENSLRGRVAQ
ncbi:MAG: DNA polymerase III subunit epsilon [Epsilonproteobacteria bacterium]|nr:DNA polymerase III subunit epsilon [Campylobacterota bacterium]NPA89335.1 3'-5' exonuclease [Campylobacterota bacterium]